MRTNTLLMTILIILVAPRTSAESHSDNIVTNPSTYITVKSGQLEVNLAYDEIAFYSIENPRISCILPEKIKKIFSAVLTNVSICQPRLIDDKPVHCLIQPTADIELIDENDVSQKLQPVVCHSGRTLCGDKDEQLREALAQVYRVEDQLDCQ